MGLLHQGEHCAAEYGAVCGTISLLECLGPGANQGQSIGDMAGCAGGFHHQGVASTRIEAALGFFEHMVDRRIAVGAHRHPLAGGHQRRDQLAGDGGLARSRRPLQGQAHAIGLQQEGREFSGFRARILADALVQLHQLRNCTALEQMHQRRRQGLALEHPTLS